jgi:cytochrome c
MDSDVLDVGTQRTRTSRRSVLSVLLYPLLCFVIVVPGVAQTPGSLGREPSPEKLRAIDIDVLPDGRGLPAGQGTAQAGRAIYMKSCRTCHGDTGTEGPYDSLVGGRGSLAGPRPVKTVGSYWPYATTLWDYINRTMPFAAPRTLAADDVYSVTAYVLFLNGIVTEQQVLSQATLAAIVMPNRGGFIPDTRNDEHLPRK